MFPQQCLCYVWHNIQNGLQKTVCILISFTHIKTVKYEVLISMKKENEEKALDILKSLDLLPYRERHPVSLSGGEKQRVAVATAIASERSVLLFDEPTSGLDYRHMLQVARLFEKLRNHGKTILVVTHDLEFIEALHANTICLEELQA